MEEIFQKIFGKKSFIKESRWKIQENVINQQKRAYKEDNKKKKGIMKSSRKQSMIS